MIEQAWDALLDFASQFVIPDWGGLIALLPVFIVILVVLFFARVIYVYATIGPQAGPRPAGAARSPRPASTCRARRTPRSSPRSASFFLFLGLVFPGWLLLVGIVIARRRHCSTGAARRSSTTTTSRTPIRRRSRRRPTGPPAGVHIPGPTFRPFLVALGLGLLFAGLVFGAGCC